MHTIFPTPLLLDFLFRMRYPCACYLKMIKKYLQLNASTTLKYRHFSQIKKKMYKIASNTDIPAKLKKMYKIASKGRGNEI